MENSSQTDSAPKITIEGANRLQKQTGRVPAAFKRMLTTPIARGSIVQWAGVGVVGIVLGIYTIGVSSLPPRWAYLSVLAVLCPFIAMVVGNVQKLLLAVILLDIPFQLDIHLAYRDEVAELGALGGWNISVTTLSLLVLYALWLGELLARVKPRSRSLLRTSLPLVLYLAFVALSVVAAHDVILSAFEIFLLLQMFLLYVYIAGTVRTRQDVLFIVIMLFIGLVLESLVMVALRFVGHSFSVAGMLARIDPDNRVGGTVGSPINAAAYLCLLLAPAMSILLTRLAWYYKWLAALAFGLGGVALVLTFSRGGWIAFFLSSAILCLLAWRRGWLSITIPFSITVVVVLLFLLFQDAILVRLLGDDNGSASARVPLMKLAFRVIKDKPVLGVGINNFPIIMKQYATPEFGGAWLYAIHDKYLLVWAETGIGGLVAFIWFLLATVRRGWQCWKLSDRFLSPLALGFTAAIAGQMVHMFVDVFHSRPEVQLLWLVAGLITAIRNMDGEG